MGPQHHMWCHQGHSPVLEPTTGTLKRVGCSVVGLRLHWLRGSSPYEQAHIPCLGGRPCHVHAPCCSSVSVCSWPWRSFGAMGCSPPLKALLEAQRARGR